MHYCLNYFTETWYKSLLLITILIISFLVIKFLVKIFIETFKQKIPFISSVILLCLAYLSKSEWCYLAVIIIIAYKGQLIDEKMQRLIKEICNIFSKNPKDITSSISTEEKVSQDMNKELESNNIEFKSRDSYKLKVLQSYKKVIDWFKQEQGIFFEQERDLIYKDFRPIQTDGYYSTKCKDYILEIKRGYNSHNLFNVIENGFNALQQCEKYYEDSDKVVEFHLAIVFNSSANIDYKSLNTYFKTRIHSKKYNYIVSIFQEDEENNLKLVYGIAILKADVYVFK